MSRTMRLMLIHQAERALRYWAGDGISREKAAEELPNWHAFEGLDDEMVADVLSRFPASEPPAVPGLDFLAVEADAQAIVAEVVAVPVCRLAEAGVEHPPHEWRTPAGDWLPCGDAAATVSEPAPAVWDDSVPPGGFVCSVCRTPVESEPCELHGAGVRP